MSHQQAICKLCIRYYLLHTSYEALLQLLQALMLQAASAVLPPVTPLTPCLAPSRAIPGGQLSLELAGGAFASSPWGTSGSPDAPGEALAKGPSHVRAERAMCTRGC